MSLRWIAAAAVLTCTVPVAAQAQTAAEVVQRHVDSMKTGDLNKVMADYSADTVVVTPQGLVSDQKPAVGPGVFSGQAEARRVFTVLTSPGSLPGIKAMETRIEPVGTDGALLHWVQNKGKPNQVAGKDVFIVRNNKIVYQTILVD